MAFSPDLRLRTDPRGCSFNSHLLVPWIRRCEPEGLPWLTLLGFLAMFSVASGLTRPPVFDLPSNLTPARDQEMTLGVAQNAGSLARIVGPIFAATLFDHHPVLMPFAAPSCW